ncbi:hypothetical protein [Streptomyces sp. GESEQ-35]|uniref:hypothetical protein n=1 Tax=Streptomyces sp. GESEQ-35 TaxID=2812657 RepID=UPI001B31A6D2|nr:hypothetical protein [Streptomyces sp. GESEQ-35]
MRKPQIDYAAVFRALPGMVALLTPELVYADANEDFPNLPTIRIGQQLPRRLDAEGSHEGTLAGSGPPGVASKAKFERGRR